jgi:protein ImuB
MRRVISLWLPSLPTDRLRRSGAVPPDPAAPLVTVSRLGRHRALAAVDANAARLGLRPGMAVAQAQAMVPGLSTHNAEPAADAAALRRLAGWCLRYAPLTAVDPPDGVWIDITGAAHLRGGERAVLRDLLGRLRAQGLAARAAIADMPGAAHALARFTPENLIQSSVPGTILPPGTPPIPALSPLPIAALRLPGETQDELRQMGIERIGDLLALPRAPLTRRFGGLPLTRLNQALGAVFEPLTPEPPAELIQATRSFAEPLSTREALAQALHALLDTVRARLVAEERGARRLDLLFIRSDASVQALRVGTARATRDRAHLFRLLEERLERVDPGFGVETMRLIVSEAEPLPPTQETTVLTGAPPDITPLLDRLANRLGPNRVYRLIAVASDVPERAVRRVPVGEGASIPWPRDAPRPVRLLDPPQPIEVMALLPDHPPAAFIWRRVRHRVRHADGPERIAGEWWLRAGETHAVRDYFRVEDENGRRYWLFRRGDSADLGIGGWFLHGFF